MMQPDIQRLSHIRDYCVEIEKTVHRCKNSFHTFSHDPDLQRSISFCILQIGELSGGLSEDFRSTTANRIQWGPIKGMRNMVAHNYGSMSLDVIWETAKHDIPILKVFCNEYLPPQKPLCQSVANRDVDTAPDFDLEI